MEAIPLSELPAAGLYGRSRDQPAAREEGLSPRDPGSLVDNRAPSRVGDKGESLKKIHAQSSAETSGLGDSLQRIHAHSSTETSGYGEVPTPSPDGPYPRSLPGHDRDRSLSPARRRQSLDMAISGDMYGDTIKSEENAGAGRHAAHNPGHLSTVTSAKPQTAVAAPPIIQPTDYFESQVGRKGEAPRTSRKPRNASEAGLDLTLYGYVAPQPDPARLPTVAQDGDTSAAANVLFLGKATQSTWLKWSQERRASLRKRLDNLEERQKEMERTRVTTPVLKARKESIMFVHPDLENSHLVEGVDDVLTGSLPVVETGPEPAAMVDTQNNQQQPPLANALTTTDTNRHLFKTRPKRTEPISKADVKLTLRQWNALMAYWDHDCFVHCRYSGSLLSLLAFILGIVSIADNRWIHFSGRSASSTLCDCHKVFL